MTPPPPRETPSEPPHKIRRQPFPAPGRGGQRCPAPAHGPGPGPGGGGGGSGGAIGPGLVVKKDPVGKEYKIVSKSLPVSGRGERCTLGCPRGSGAVGAGCPPRRGGGAGWGSVWRSRTR